MPANDPEAIPVLKVTTDWVTVDVVDGPDIILTRRGYIPSLIIRAGNAANPSRLFIGSWSIAEKLEPLKRANHDSFKGLKFKVRKESMEKFGKYQVEKM